MNRFEADRRFAQRMKDNYPPGKGSGYDQSSRPYGIGTWTVLYRELLYPFERQGHRRQETTPVSHRVALYADFDAQVEEVPDKQASGEIRAVSARFAQREIQRQIVRLPPAIWLQDKGGWL